MELWRRRVGRKRIIPMAGGNSQLLRGLSDVAELKKGPGGDILVYGSATLAKGLLHHGLVDEVRLLLCPVSVGGGLRLFDDDRGLHKFTLKGSRALDNGVVILEYRVAG